MSADDTASDPLAGRQFTPITDAAQAQVEGEQQAQETEAAAMAAIRKGTADFLYAALKVLRKVVAKRLPEIEEEWTDPTLRAPADAAVPLVEKYLSVVMAVVGKNPELAAFAMACLPLAMGYVNATERHEEKARNTIEMPPPGPAAGPA